MTVSDRMFESWVTIKGREHDRDDVCIFYSRIRASTQVLRDTVEREIRARYGDTYQIDWMEVK